VIRQAIDIESLSSTARQGAAALAVRDARNFPWFPLSRQQGKTGFFPCRWEFMSKKRPEILMSK
jgi:hypothetical protein